MAKTSQTNTSMSLLIKYVMDKLAHGDAVKTGHLLADRKFRTLIAYDCALELVKQEPYSHYTPENWILFHEDCAKGLRRG